MYVLEVHFDFITVGEDVEVGSVVLSDGEVVHSRLESFKDLKDKGNNYHFSILAWITGVTAVREFIEDEGDIFDAITFVNQNELIFKWAESGKCPVSYEKGISKLYANVKGLLSEVSIEFNFKKVSGKENKAKKLMQKRKKKKETKTERAMSFGGLNKLSKDEIVDDEVGEKEDNIVDFYKLREANGS